MTHSDLKPDFWPGLSKWMLPDWRRFMVLSWDPALDIVRIFWLHPERRHNDVSSADLVGAERQPTP